MPIRYDLSTIKESIQLIIAEANRLSTEEDCSSRQLALAITKLQEAEFWLNNIGVPMPKAYSGDLSEALTYWRELGRDK